MTAKIQRVAAYVRVSTGGQTTRSQEHAITEFCRRRGWRRVTWFREQGGGAARSRPVFERMLGEIRAGEFASLVAYKLDRLGRSVSHLVLLLEELEGRGVPVVIVADGIDTAQDTALGRMQRHLLAAFAAFERDLIRERTREGLRAAKARGTRLGRPAAAAALAGQIQAAQEKGQTVREIAQALGISAASVSRHGKRKSRPGKPRSA